MNQPAAVRAEGLAKTFGARMAVRELAFSLSEGDCLAVFGPNGAGKTELRKRGPALSLATHNGAEGLALASHAAVMLDGRFARHDARPAPGFDAPAFSAQYRQLVGVARD